MMVARRIAFEFQSNGGPYFRFFTLTFVLHPWSRL